jgi:ribosomal protein L21E
LSRPNTQENPYQN